MKEPTPQIASHYIKAERKLPNIHKRSPYVEMEYPTCDNSRYREELMKDDMPHVTMQMWSSIFWRCQMEFVSKGLKWIC